MTRGEVTFLFHRKEGTAVQATTFMNFANVKDLDGMQRQVIDAIIDFTEDKQDQYRCVTVVVDIPDLEHYLTAMVTFDEEGEEWLKTMAMHKEQETIH